MEELIRFPQAIQLFYCNKNLNILPKKQYTGLATMVVTKIKVESLSLSIRLSACLSQPVLPLKNQATFFPVKTRLFIVYPNNIKLRYCSFLVLSLDWRCHKRGYYMVRRTLKEKTLDFLRKRSGRKFTAREIAAFLVKKYPKEFERKMKDSNFINTEEQLIQSLSGEINTTLERISKSPQLKISSVPSPKKFCWIKKTDG